ncbi:MAG: hypothetical protein AAGB19_00400 [Cyanobacteria bacterium P01_F01_bin.3]
MQYILHDLSVVRWAIVRCHPSVLSTRLTVTSPIRIQQLAPISRGAWVVRFQRPAIHILPPYEIELAYLLAHGGKTPLAK